MFCTVRKLLISCIVIDALTLPFNNRLLLILQKENLCAEFMNYISNVLPYTKNVQHQHNYGFNFTILSQYGVRTCKNFTTAQVQLQKTFIEIFALKWA